ncbi:MAG: hypothetical protein JRE24_01720 [Deltaproteobacteria bacterium]|nr:hypothetical protein [Deltaproteobacteria bacterium]
MSRIAGFDARGAVDAYGVPLAPADLPKPLQRETADRNDTIEQIRLLQSDVAGPQNCQQHDAD